MILKQMEQENKKKLKYTYIVEQFLTLINEEK